MTRQTNIHGVSQPFRHSGTPAEQAPRSVFRPPIGGGTGRTGKLADVEIDHGTVDCEVKR